MSMAGHVRAAWVLGLMNLKYGPSWVEFRPAMLRLHQGDMAKGRVPAERDRNYTFAYVDSLYRRVLSRRRKARTLAEAFQLAKFHEGLVWQKRSPA